MLPDTRNSNGDTGIMKNEIELVTCPGCGHSFDRYEPDRVSIYGMYDCHLFHRFEAGSVEKIVADWIEHNSTPTPGRFISGDETNDLGATSLCPVIVLCGKKEIRRVGQMVHASRSRGYDKEKLQAWIDAVNSDPDIGRILAAS